MREDVDQVTQDEDRELDDKAANLPPVIPRAGKTPLPIMILGNVIVPIVLAFVGVWGVKYLFDNAPQAKRGEAKRNPRLVEVIGPDVGDHQLEITAYGMIDAARPIEINSRIAGAVEWVDPRLREGGFFKAGEVMVRLDKSDLLIQQAIAAQEFLRAEQELVVLDAEVKTAAAALESELARAAVAEREYELLDDETKSKLTSDQKRRMLRVHFLDEARAKVASIEAKKKILLADQNIAEQRQARVALDLERAEIRAPFDAYILERMVEENNQINTSDTLARAIATDVFYAKVSLPESTLTMLDLPAMRLDESGAIAINTDRDGVAVAEADKAHDAKVYVDSWPAGTYRSGRILGRLPEQSTSGRQAIILIAIEDPFAIKADHRDQPVLPLKAFVRAELLGKTLENHARIPRSAIHSGELWLAGNDDTLVKATGKDAIPTYQSREYAFIPVSETSALQPDSRLIVSALSTPVPGLLLNVRRRGEAADLPEALGEPDKSEGSSE